jgi:hypothetical protein
MFSWAKLTRDTVIAGLAFAYSVWAIWGSGEEWLAKGFMLLLFGIPVFVWMKWRAKREARVDDFTDWELFDRQRLTLRPTPTADERTPVGLGID